MSFGSAGAQAGRRPRTGGGRDGWKKKKQTHFISTSSAATRLRCFPTTRSVSIVELAGSFVPRIEVAAIGGEPSSCVTSEQQGGSDRLQKVFLA